MTDILGGLFGASLFGGRSNPTVAGKNATEERRELDRVNMKTMLNSRLAPGDYVLLVYAGRGATDVQADMSKVANRSKRPYFQVGTVIEARPYAAVLVKMEAVTTPSAAFDPINKGLAYILPGSPSRTGGGFFNVSGVLQILQGNIAQETQRQAEDRQKKEESGGLFGGIERTTKRVTLVIVIVAVLAGLVFVYPYLPKPAR